MVNKKLPKFRAQPLTVNATKGTMVTVVDHKTGQTITRDAAWFRKYSPPLISKAAPEKVYEPEISTPLEQNHRPLQPRNTEASELPNEGHFCNVHEHESDNMTEQEDERPATTPANNQNSATIPPRRSSRERQQPQRFNPSNYAKKRP